MRVFFLCALLALALPLRAQTDPLPAQEFDARILGHADKRVIQAALSLTGDYAGLLDGAWGGGSQRALERFTRRELGIDKPRFADLGPLLTGFEAEWRANGWTSIYFDSSDFTITVPGALLSEETDTLTYASPDGSLIVGFSIDRPAEALERHARVLEAAARGTEPYRSPTPERIVTSVTAGSGSRFYLRSDAGRGLYSSVMIGADPIHAGRLALIAASIQPGRAPDLAIVATSPLRALLNLSPAAPAPPPPAATARVGTASGEVAASTGTGFYVNNTDLVTANHVVDGCRAIRLADGSALAVIGRDPGLDLAVLGAERRSRVWLSLGAEPEAKLGETVYALGYPFLDLLGQGLSVTGGNVSALGAPGEANAQIMVSAPVQPGNSGGPLLNARAEIVGVVVARLDDMKMLEATGTLPQNMNFAVPADVLKEFLEVNAVAAAPGGHAANDIASGIADEVRDSVVSVHCYR